MECPLDYISINENKARLTALFVLLLTAVYLLTGFWLIMAFLVADFALRALNLGKYSLLGFISDKVIKQLKIKYKATDRAPKRFAAMVGLAFTTAILIACILNLGLTGIVLALIMTAFAFLESFLGFCAGCYVYSIGKAIFK
jgi:hypothetical protein